MRRLRRAQKRNHRAHPADNKLSEAGRITVSAGSRRGKCGQYVGKPIAHQLKTPEITGIPGVSIGGDGGI